MHTEQAGRDFQVEHETDLCKSYEETEVFKSGKADHDAFDSFCACAWMVHILNEYGIDESLILKSVWEVTAQAKWKTPFRDATRIINNLTPAKD